MIHTEPVIPDVIWKQWLKQWGGGGVKEATNSLKPMLISNTPALIWTYDKTGWDQLPKWGIIALMGNNIQNGT